MNKHISAVVIGTALEYYDYVLYVHFLIILSPLFFPNNRPEINVLIGFSSLIVGYVARPIGGIVFGHIGDRLGRKQAMSAAILCSALATLGISLLPPYAQIGLLAPLGLVLFRCIQGFSVGGETSAAACFLLECSNENNKCLRSSYLNIASMGAGIIATLLGILCTQDFMPNWCWRIPFAVAILFGAIGFYIRDKLEESPEFKQVIRDKKIVKVPLKDVLQKDKLSILCSIGMCAGYAAPFTILYAYLPNIMKTEFGFSAPNIFWIGFGIMVFAAITSPLIGILGDKIGKSKTTLVFGTAFLLLIYPLFSIIYATKTPLGVFGAELIITLLASCMAIPFYAILCRMYPTQRRHSGVAFSIGMGMILFGGMSPLICKTLVNITANVHAPAIWLMICSAIMLIALRFSPKVAD